MADLPSFDEMLSDQAPAPMSFDDMPEDAGPNQGLGETLKAGAEGVASGLAGPLAPYLENKAGVLKADIRGRKESHPIAHGVGEGTGLVGGMLTGVGEGAVMGKAGELAAEASNLAKPVSYVARVGSSAVKQAAEMAVLQSSDEAAKLVLNDPQASAENAIANIGLASAIGGAGGAFITGAVSPLWKATVGNKAESFLKGLTSHLGGVEGAVADSEGLASKTGLDVSPALQSVIDDRPGAMAQHSKLSQTDTTAYGRRYQEDLEDLYRQIHDKAGETLGKTPAEIEGLEKPDKYTIGQTVGDSLKDEIKAQTAPIEQAYDKINNKFKSAEFNDFDKYHLSTNLSQKAIENGWHKMESDVQGLLDKTLKDLPKQENLADIKNYITGLRDNNPYGSSTYQASKQIQGLFKDAQEAAIERELGATNPNAISEYSTLKRTYADFMNNIDNLNEHLHVGRYDGPKSFLKALGELSQTNGEGVLNRLSGVNKANSLELLKEYPQTLEHIKNYHTDRLIDESKTNGKLNIDKLMKKISDKPQIKALVMGPEQESRLMALQQVAARLKDPTHNWSNTARTVDKLTHGAVSPLAMLATLMGHGTAGILSHLGKLGFSEGSDALRYSMMKFLSSSEPIESEGFKAMAQFLHNTIRGENLLTKATAAVLKPGAQVLTDSAIPTLADREKLDKKIEELQDNPNDVTALLNGKTGHYMPDHQTQLTRATSQSVQYLQQLKPRDKQIGPLDKPVKPTPAEIARYNRALDIANQPMVVLQHVKDGTLKTTDLQDLQAMYPSVYKQIATKLGNNIANAQGDEQQIPYKTRMGMSLFLGQALDASMQPQSIMAAQQKANAPPPQQQAKPKNKQTLNKGPKMYQTTTQAAESDRSGRE